VRLIISESSAEGLDDFTLRHLDRVKVKGKNEPVDIYEPVGLSGALSDVLAAEVAESNVAMEYYFAADWERAILVFKSLQDAWPDDLRTTAAR